MQQLPLQDDYVRRCTHCGAPLPPWSCGRPRLYCDEACRRRAKKAATAGARHPKPSKPCRYCGKPFLPRYREAYCSERCRMDAANARAKARWHDRDKAKACPDAATPSSSVPDGDIAMGVATGENSKKQQEDEGKHDVLDARSPKPRLTSNACGHAPSATPRSWPDTSKGCSAHGGASRRPTPHVAMGSRPPTSTSGMVGAATSASARCASMSPPSMTSHQPSTILSRCCRRKQ